MRSLFEFAEGTAPRVTVLMSVYNGERYISEAVSSILAQSFSDFEFLIFDDASTDKSLEIIKNFADPRIRVTENSTRKGLATNLNQGIREARGEYVARMDGDDISMSHRLARQVAFMDANPDLGASGTYAVDMNDAGSDLKMHKVRHGRALEQWIWMPSPMIHPTVIFRKSIIHKFGGYDASLRAAQDYDLWLRLNSVGIKLDNLPEVLLRYRIHSQNVTKSNRADQLLTTYRIFKRQYPQTRLSYEEFKSLILEDFIVSPWRRYRHLRRLTRMGTFSFALAKNTIRYAIGWGGQHIREMSI